MASNASVDELSLDGKSYAIVAQTLMPSGQRSIVRKFRDSNASDPGRIKRIEWDIWGPIGASRKSTSGRLSIDYCTNLETRFPRRLISKGARNAVSLAAVAPPGTGDAFFGGFFFGSTSSTFGAPVTGGGITAFDEQAGYLFAHGGRSSTQIGPLASAWTVVASTLHGASVRGAASWFAKGRVAVGQTVSMRTRTAVSTTGATYADTTSTSPAALVYANSIATGSDRSWIAQGDPAGTNNNLITYTLNDFATMAATFQVGDPKVGVTGIGPFGPFTMFGQYNGISSFTDQGKPVPLSTALRGHYSANNGSQWADPGWGWNYYIADTGLRCTNGSIDNPVGIGETMREFTGHGGRPTAIWSERGELFIFYLDGANSYGYRCTFGPETPGSGQPLFYPWHYLASTESLAIFSSNTPTNTAVVWGEGENIAYETIDRTGRDDLFTARVYDTNGGVAYLTTFDDDPNLLKNLRSASLRTKNVTGSSWTLAFSFDDGAYVNCGSAVSTATYTTLRPTSGSGATLAPLSTVSGRPFKPRLTQASGGSSSTPPEVNGTLEVEYDERPEVIEEIVVTVNLTGTAYDNNTVIDNLKALVSVDTASPVEWAMSDDPVPVGSTGKRYAVVAGVGNRRDLKTSDGNGIEAVDVTIQRWETA